MLLENIDTLIYELKLNKELVDRVNREQTKRNTNHFLNHKHRDALFRKGVKLGIKKTLPGLLSAGLTTFDIPSMIKTIKNTAADIKHKRYENFKDPKLMITRAADFIPGTNAITAAKDIFYDGPLRAAKYDRIAKRRQEVNPEGRNLKTPIPKKGIFGFFRN